MNPEEQPAKKGEQSPTPSRYRSPWLDALLLVIALIELLALFPHTLNGDAAPRFAALSQLLTGHGVPTTKYSLIGPLVMAASEMVRC